MHGAYAFSLGYVRINSCVFDCRTGKHKKCKQCLAFLPNLGNRPTVKSYVRIKYLVSIFDWVTWDSRQGQRKNHPLDYYQTLVDAHRLYYESKYATTFFPGRIFLCANIETLKSFKPLANIEKPFSKYVSFRSQPRLPLIVVIFPHKVNRLQLTDSICPDQQHHQLMW